MGLGRDIMPHTTLLERTLIPLTRHIDSQQLGLSFWQSTKVLHQRLRLAVWRVIYHAIFPSSVRRLWGTVFASALRTPSELCWTSEHPSLSERNSGP